MTYRSVDLIRQFMDWCALCLVNELKESTNGARASRLYVALVALAMQ